ncbi:MAG: hypothetical protein Q9210_002538 [Variospora velana]
MAAQSLLDDAADNFNAVTGDFLKQFEQNQDFDFSSFNNFAHQVLNLEVFEEDSSKSNDLFWTSCDPSSEDSGQERNDDQLLHVDNAESTGPDLPQSHIDLVESLRNSYFPVSRTVFSLLVEKILGGCSIAATIVDPEHGGTTDCGDDVDYDFLNIQSRQAQYLDAFQNGADFQQPSEVDSKSSHETVIDDSDVNTALTDVPSPSEEDVQFEPITEHSSSNMITTPDEASVYLVQDQHLNTIPNFEFSTFEQFNLVSDFPETDDIFHDFVTPATLLTPTTSTDPQPRGQTPSSTTQRKICNIPGCSKAFTGIESTNNLRRHKREKHSNRSSWSCPFENCDLVSSRLHNIRQHWVKKHKDAPMPDKLMTKRAKEGGGLSRKMSAGLPMV